MRTEPPAALAAVAVLAEAAEVAAATAELVLEAAFFLGIGEDAARARREKVRIEVVNFILTDLFGWFVVGVKKV